MGYDEDYDFEYDYENDDDDVIFLKPIQSFCLI